MPPGLSAHVLARVAFARRREARVRAAVLGVLVACLVGALTFLLQYAASELYTSGFYEYASLLFSNSGFVLASWREMGFLLLESLPAIALLLVLAASAALVYLVRRTLATARVAFMRIA